MRILIESLKRLYKTQRITEQDVQIRRNTGKISQEELEYILDNKNI